MMKHRKRRPKRPFITIIFPVRRIIMLDGCIRSLSIAASHVLLLPGHSWGYTRAISPIRASISPRKFISDKASRCRLRRPEWKSSKLDPVIVRTIGSSAVDWNPLVGRSSHGVIDRNTTCSINSLGPREIKYFFVTTTTSCGSIALYSYTRSIVETPGQSKNLAYKKFK